VLFLKEIFQSLLLVKRENRSKRQTTRKHARGLLISSEITAKKLNNNGEVTYMIK